MFFVFISIFFVHEKSFASVDKGQWTLVNDSMQISRYRATANLLPNGNVLIMGENLPRRLNRAEIFDPKQQKIIKIIPIKHHFMSSQVSATSLKNGDIYISYTYKDNETQEYVPTSVIFDSKTYTFKEINNTFEGKVVSTANDTHILLKNGHLLIVPKECEYRYIIVYNPDKDEYYKVIGEQPDDYIPESSFFQLENGDIIFRGIHKFYIYKLNENKFEIYKDLPRGKNVQMDNENYMIFDCIKDSYTKATIYNIRTEETKSVKNHIKAWFMGSVLVPKMVALDNGNLLVAGAYYSKLRIFGGYTTYIYNRNNNKFYKIANPPFDIFESTAHITLPNGDILFVGGRHKTGKRIQIYSYKHKENDR